MMIRSLKVILLDFKKWHKVPDSLRIEFYSDYNFNGEKKIYEGEHTCLENPFSIKVLIAKEISFI
jgi:hypothetical protein